MLLFLPLFFFVGLYHRFILLFLCRRQGRAGPDEIVALVLEPLRRTVNLVHGFTEVLQVTHCSITMIGHTFDFTARAYSFTGLNAGLSSMRSSRRYPQPRLIPMPE